MAVELVLLSGTPPTLELQQMVLGILVGSGTVTQWSNGALSTVFSETGTRLLRVHNPKRIHDVTGARATLHDPPETFCWWTDLVLRDPEAPEGRTSMQLAIPLATGLDGVLCIRK